MVGDEKHRGFGFVEFYTKKEAKVRTHFFMKNYISTKKENNK